MIKIAITLVVVIAVLCVLIWLATTPKKIELQPELSSLETLNFDTSLLLDTESPMIEDLMLRRVRDSAWITSGEHTEFSVKNYQEPSMRVDHVKPYGVLKTNSNEPARILLGRINDTGDGSHGWHVTMIREGSNPISLERHQRYRVWIEKDFPIGFTDEGEPKSIDPKRWYFSGLADIVSKQHYNGYVEPAEGDK